jgi:hypothetical protein
MSFPYPLPLNFPSALTMGTLVIKNQFLRVSRDATELFVKDTTGLYEAALNPNGYGTPNITVAQISKIIFTLSDYVTSTVYDYLYPDINAVLAGEELTITPQNLDAPANYVFEDGAYDLNEYVVSVDLFDILLATAGGKIVQLSTPVTQTYLYQFDSIIDNNGNIYNIDKTGTFVATVINTVEPLIAGITTLQPVYRANLKFLNATALQYDIAREAAQACKPKAGTSKAVILTYNMIAADIAFQMEDYNTANILVSQSFNSIC